MITTSNTIMPPTMALLDNLVANAGVLPSHFRLVLQVGHIATPSAISALQDGHFKSLISILLFDFELIVRISNDPDSTS